MRGNLSLSGVHSLDITAEKQYNPFDYGRASYTATFGYKTYSQEDLSDFTEFLKTYKTKGLSEVSDVSYGINLDRKPDKPESPAHVSRYAYEKAYRDFVDAKTLDEADEHFKTMLNWVSLSLEPRPDGKSWVSDWGQEKKQIKQKEPRGTYFPVYFLWSFVASFVVIMILSSAGVIH